MYADGEFDVATLIYNKFKSAIEQTVTRLQLLPFAVEGADEDAEASDEAGSAYEYEPDEEAVLKTCCHAMWRFRCTMACWKMQRRNMVRG